MAHSATATQRFETWRRVAFEEILYLPGDPGVTYTRGELCYGDLTTAGESGLIMQAGAGQANTIGTVHQTTICPANTTSFPLPLEFDPSDRSGSNLCLIPIRMHVPEGTVVYRVTFEGHTDETVASYSAPTITDTTGHTANDNPNGALVYIYEGPGIGEVNIVDDYVHSGTTTVCHRNFATTLTSSSKYISLDGENSTFKGIGPVGRIDVIDDETVNCAQGADDGDYMIYMSWQEAGTFLNNLTVPVISAKAVL
jgi:hypothetical protein